MPNYLGDKDIDILNTKYHYGNLDKGWGHCQNYTFYKAAKNILDDNKGLDNDSDKILRALCYVYTKSSREHFDKNICNFLYFWLGDILLKKLEKNIFFQDIISDLFKTLTNNNNQVCQLPHYYMYNYEFQDYKLIFDCSEDYKSYEVQHIYPRISCNNNYNTHLEKNTEIYNRFYSECKVQSLSKPYCDTFKKYFPNNESNLLSKFRCNLILSGPDPKKSIENREEESEQPTEKQGVERVTNQAQLDQTRREIALPEDATHSSIYPFKREISDIYGISELSDGTSPSIISKSATGAVSVAGALVPSYLLYRYTPAGNLINKLLGRTTRMNHNPLMEAQLMNNFYQPEGFNSERSGYNISYRPV
ncbi:PIR protein [Plasmodium vivax]|uniref:VIR protein n=1 Tax=Plasmodium vivax TaxID=5855 RepID=A0A565A8C9_PLAVI|nr:PIR protein [Plasmodium vivax]